MPPPSVIATSSNSLSSASSQLFRSPRQCHSYAQEQLCAWTAALTSLFFQLMCLLKGSLRLCGIALALPGSPVWHRRSWGLRSPKLHGGQGQAREEQPFSQLLLRTFLPGPSEQPQMFPSLSCKTAAPAPHSSPCPNFTHHQSLLSPFMSVFSEPVHKKPLFSPQPNSNQNL